MNHDHIDPKHFRQAIRSYGDLDGHEALGKHLHLVSCCAECTRRVLNDFNLASLEEIHFYPDPVEELLRRGSELKGIAAALWLESLADEERLAQAAADARLHGQPVLLGLLARAKELRSTAPAMALGLTAAAVAILPHLKPTTDDILEPEEMSAKVWAHHGNLHRVLSDLNEADRCFRKAQKLLAPAHLDELVRAEVLALKSSLRRAQRRYRDAKLAIDKAAKIYDNYGYNHQQGEALLASAKLRCEGREYTAALEQLERATALLDLAREPRLEQAAASIHLHLLCETGSFDQAAALVPRARVLAAKHGGPAEVLRVAWCEAVIAQALALPVAAEPAFVAVRRGFIELGNAYDAALVSLDLAVLWAEQGRTEEIKTLAQEMLTIFESRGVKTEALAAAFLFCRAVWQEQATVAALKGIREQLKEAQRA